jgi:hypothetical protein
VPPVPPQRNLSGGGRDAVGSAPSEGSRDRLRRTTLHDEALTLPQVLTGTQRWRTRPAQGQDLRVLPALTRRRSGVRVPQRPPGNGPTTVPNLTDAKVRRGNQQGQILAGQPSELHVRLAVAAYPRVERLEGLRRKDQPPKDGRAEEGQVRRRVNAPPRRGGCARAETQRPDVDVSAPPLRGAQRHDHGRPR